MILTAIINIPLAFYLLKKKNVPGNIFFTLMLFASSEWALANAIEYMVPLFFLKILLTKFSYIGLVATPPLLLYFSVHFTRLNEKISLRILPYIWIVPVIILIAAFTNDYHFQLWKSYIPMYGVLGFSIFYQTGPFIWLYAGYSYLMLVLSMYVLLKYYSKIHKIYKLQVSLLVLSFIYPWISNFLYLFRINPFPELDITPLAFFLTTITLLFAIIRAELFQLVPQGKETLFMAMPDAVLVLDNKLRIIDLNPAVKRIFGNSDYLGKQIHTCFSEINPGMFEEIITPVKFEYKIVKNDSTVWFDVLISTINGKLSVVEGYLIVFRDINKIKNSEEVLIESEKKLIELNEAKDKFFSLIAHDLKNPISSFMQITELLANEFKNFTEDEKYEIVDTLRNSSNNIYELLQNILTWSRLQRGLIEFSPGLNNIKYIIDTNITLFTTNANNKNIKIETHLSENIFAYADSNMLFSIIRNLMSNAIKFTPNDGRIDISCSDYDFDMTANPNQYLKISISDTGIGLSATDIEKLFRIDTSFRMIGSSSEKGTGLGLILCRDFVEMHGCKIWVNSILGQGSTFSFTIPKYQNNRETV